MACIVEKLAANLNKEVTSKGVWEHLATMYDLKKLVSCLRLLVGQFSPHTHFELFDRMNTRQSLSPMKRLTLSFPLKNTVN